jgi:putative transposase
MADHGVVCSMSRSGNVWDNAAMESFFSSLKTERTARKLYRTRNEAKADVFDYVERFYNPKRRHSTIGYLSPMEFERKCQRNRVQTKPGLPPKSFRPKDGNGDQDGGANFHGQKRKNNTHVSTSDPDSRLYRKAAGREAKLCYMGLPLEAWAGGWPAW